MIKAEIQFPLTNMLVLATNYSVLILSTGLVFDAIHACEKVAAVPTSAANVTASKNKYQYSARLIV